MTDKTATQDPAIHGHAKGQLLKRSVIGSIWMVGSAFATRFVKIIVFACLARLLVPEDFGLYAGAMVVFSLTGAFVGMGLGVALIQRKEIQAEHVFMALLSTLTLGILATVFVYTYSQNLAEFIGLPRLGGVFQLFAPLCILQSLTVVPQALISKAMRFSLPAKIQFVTFVVGYALVALPLAYIGAGTWSLFIGNAVQFSLSPLLLTIFQRADYQVKFSLRALKDLFVVGFGLTLAQVATILGRNGDYFIVGRFLNGSALGIYSRAYGLMETVVALFSTATQQIFLPLFSASQDNNERLRDAMRINLSIVMGIYIVIGVIFITVADELILVLLGPQWGEAVLPFQILCLGMCFRAGWKISTTILVAKGLTYRASLCQFTYAALVLTGAFLGSQNGLPGVATGVLAALFITFVMSQVMASRRVDFPISLYWKAVTRAAALILITFVPAYGVAQLSRGFFSVPLITLIFAGFAGVMGPLFLTTFRPSFVLDPYSLLQLGKFTQHLPQRFPQFSRIFSALPIFQIRESIVSSKL